MNVFGFTLPAYAPTVIRGIIIAFILGTLLYSYLQGDYSKRPK